MGIFRSIFTVAHVVIVLLLGATMLNAYIPPKVFSLLNLLSLAFPILMIANLLLCFFWIFSWRKRAFIFLLISTLFLTPVRRWINYSEQKNVKEDFKVLTFNNKVNEYGKEEVESYINSFEADFVFLQEAGYSQSGNPILGEMKYSFHNPIISFYSKYEIIEKGPIAFVNNGDAIYADVIVKGKRIRFVNVYLEPFQLHKSMVKPTDDLEENGAKAKSLVRRFIPVFKTHEEQVQILKNFVKKSPYPVILAGDFNSVPNSYEYYTISEVLKDCFLESGTGLATSFHDYKIPIRIDYVFSSENLKSTYYKVDRNQKLSDHYPVLVKFNLKD
ncbi:endonuclease/exonuclease/phosphatase family protein [Cloacibacterium sp. TD35]|uniref:endonuclease/exonuclease/phosphatase family protein n=1 Tax=Cloacibacterium sp. TD35 TaxID=2976818 RepID=UPI00237E4E68|nr:endonuclease/exonuclease/phosphatase family protein [Cloacibacterium sp. TD35]WDT68689.1 endonuclease/exonuclease/phosphatase family protein [Cloacibacterium sp. TD35]